VATFRVGDGISKYIDNLERLSRASKETIGRAIYAGADIVTDKIREELEKIPVESSSAAAAAGRLMNGLTPSQKGGLLKGLGISKMQERDGYYDVKVGFDGYNTTYTKLWPHGQPNAMIARSLEAGTSFRTRNPVISKATRSVKDKAEREMAKAFDDSVREFFEF